jgi:hypothetical protein
MASLPLARQYASTIVVLLCLLSTPAFGETQVLFSPGGGIRDHTLTSINGCNASLEIAVYNFTSGHIAEALVNAKNRGVKIRVVMDKKQAGKEGSLYDFLKEEGFDVQLLKGRVGGSMHNSFVIFDNQLVLTGSYSWTEYAEKFNYENAIVSDEKPVVEMYQDEFNRLYAKTVAVEPKTVETKDWESLVLQETRKDEAKEKKITEVSPPTSTDAKTQEKDFIDITFEEIDKIFGSESTLSRSERNKEWKQYKGKFVRWKGEVAYRGMGRTDWNRVGIKHSEEVDVELWFDYRMLNTVYSLKKGQIITYTGMLYSRPRYSSPYRIKKAWIEEITTQKKEQQGDEGHMGGTK